MTDADPLPSFAAFGEYSTVRQPVVSIVNAPGIHVGSWVTIGAYAVIEALAPERGVTVRIGDGTYLGNFLRLTALGGVEIGRDVLVSDRVYLSDTGHLYDDVTRPINHQGLRDGRRVVVGDGAWIGIGAVICGNVSIGRNAVVGANAVVRGDVPDFSVVAGDPAEVIRYHDGTAWHWVR